MMDLPECVISIKDRYSAEGYQTVMIEDWLMMIAGQAGYCAVFFISIRQLKLYIGPTIAGIDNADVVDLTGPGSLEELDKIVNI